MVVKPVIKQFVCYQGSTFIANFQWINNVTYTLDSTSKVDMQIRPDIKSDIIICDASTTNGKITIDELTGIITVKIPATETEAFDFVKAVYDIELEFGNGDRFRIVQGTITLSLGVTRIDPIK